MIQNNGTGGRLASGCKSKSRYYRAKDFVIDQFTTIGTKVRVPTFHLFFTVTSPPQQQKVGANSGSFYANNDPNENLI